MLAFKISCTVQPFAGACRWQLEIFNGYRRRARQPAVVAVSAYLQFVRQMDVERVISLPRRRWRHFAIWHQCGLAASSWFKASSLGVIRHQLIWIQVRRIGRWLAKNELRVCRVLKRGSWLHAQGSHPRGYRSCSAQLKSEFAQCCIST